MPNQSKARGPSKRKSKAKRSKFELEVQRQLNELGVKFWYEKETFELWDKVSGHKCSDCGAKSVLRRIRYTPDWFLENGVIIESKGIFTARDRKILLLMREQHNVEVKVLLAKDNKIHKASKTRYSAWLEANGFPWAIRHVPTEWLTST